jgi:hypothetical protein
MKKTIKTLLGQGYTAADIDIFVSNNEEKAAYEATLSGYNFIVTNTMGLADKKNFITGYYPEGQQILSMDDDITKILYSPECQYKNLKALVPVLFEEMTKHNTILGGFYPAGDTRCMKNTWERGLMFVLGSMYCYINDKSITIEVSSAEDAERTLKVYDKYKCIIRYCKAAPITRYWVNKGGMEVSEADRAQKDYERKKVISETYSQYCKLITKKDRYDLRYNLKLKEKYALE